MVDVVVVVYLSFCDTSSTLEVDNSKNKAILRDLLQKWKVDCRADGPGTNAFCDFSHSICSKYCACHEFDARSYEVLHLSGKIIFPELKI